MTVLLVTGGRDYVDGVTLYRELYRFKRQHGIDLLVHGNARGADTLASEWCAHAGVHEAPISALWGKYQGRAGRIRNKTMLKCVRPDFVMAFPGGPGTAHMKEIAREAGVPVIEVNER